MNENHLTDIASLVTLTNLELLDLRYNQLKNIPLEFFDGDGEIHWVDGDMDSGLNLYDNPLETPPVEIVKQGREAIRNYFRQMDEQGRDYIYEAKILIVGHPGAGKTSLAQKILNPRYELRPEEESTKGIDVFRWAFPMETGRTFQINIWDFGGQQIYHTTHQFFLTKRSLYLLTADMREENTDFYYWLNIVELLSENSPILIIKNKKQDRSFDIGESQLRATFGANLKEVRETNLNTDMTLEPILGDIKHHLGQLPHIGSSLPKTWVKVRQALEADLRDYISLKDYFKLCQENGFTREEDKLQLSDYLHDLGVCLHFQNDILLKQTVILKPEWGTDAVYKVLDDLEVIENGGRFTEADLSRIWSEPKYSQKQPELLQLMINFKLCYALTSPKAYIAPQRLGKDKPVYPWQETDNLKVHYEYEFMPKGIITRLIVALHRHIADQRYVWQEGVILAKDGTRAEVIENWNLRKLTIRVEGDHKRDLLTIVTHHLDDIHKSYSHLKYKKMIPCNCPTCKKSADPCFYSYDTLINFLAQDCFSIQCQKDPKQQADVLSLIDDTTNLVKLLKDELGLSSEATTTNVIEQLRSLLKGSGTDKAKGLHLLAGLGAPAFLNLGNINFQENSMTSNQFNGDVINSVVADKATGNTIADNTVSKAQVQLSSEELHQLSGELTKLQEHLVRQAKTAEDFKAIATVVQAKESLDKGDQSAVWGYLKTGGRWVSDQATKIGCSLAAKIIENKMGW